MKTRKILACGLIAVMFALAFMGCGEEEKKKYTVTFDSNNGSTVDPQTVNKGDRAEKPVDPTRTTLMAGLWDKTPSTASYTFIEWQKDGAAYDFNTPVTANITLIAQWTIATAPSEKPLSGDTYNLKNIDDSIRYISSYDGDSTAFILVLEEDVDNADNGGVGISYHNEKDRTLTITSAGTSERVIRNPVFYVTKGTLVIDGNITLRGKNNKDNDKSVVSVLGGGNLELKGNAKITGNTSSSSAVVLMGGSNAAGEVSLPKMTMSDNAKISGNTGGGVNIGGEFTMNGGEISGNVGGGVKVGYGGKFIVASEAVKANIKGNKSGSQVELMDGGTFTVGGVAADGF
jgi:hypothetical protein